MTPADIRRITKLLSDIKEQLARIGIDRKANNQQSQPNPPPTVTVNALLEVPVAVREYYEAHNKHKWEPRLKTGIEIAGIAAALWLGYLNLSVLHEIRKQTPEINKAAEASDKQAQLLARQMESTLAVFINLDLGLNEEGLSVSIQNFGHSIAHGGKGQITVTRMLLPSQKAMGSATYDIMPPDLMSIDRPHLNEWAHLYVIPGFTPYSIENVARTEESVTVSGSFSYENGFGHKMTMPICSSYISYRIRNSVGGAPGVQNFVPCKEFDGVLRTAIEAKKEEAERGYSGKK
jgi:hypothetical protein